MISRFPLFVICFFFSSCSLGGSKAPVLPTSLEQASRTSEDPPTIDEVDQPVIKDERTGSVDAGNPDDTDQDGFLIVQVHHTLPEEGMTSQSQDRMPPSTSIQVDTSEECRVSACVSLWIEGCTNGACSQGVLTVEGIEFVSSSPSSSSKGVFVEYNGRVSMDLSSKFPFSMLRSAPLPDGSFAHIALRIAGHSPAMSLVIGTDLLVIQGGQRVEIRARIAE